jgi:two-component system, chemotaxis family, sensor kinase CheA
VNDLFAQEFIQDFLEESADHLKSIRENLLAIEQTLEQAQDPANNLPEDDPSVSVERVDRINELFRSVHTIKGLAGMVGLREAEELSHQMESVLAAVRKAELDISLDVIDILLGATRTLASVIGVLHDTGPDRPEAIMPDIRDSLEALGHLLPGTQTGPLESGASPNSELQTGPQLPDLTQLFTNYLELEAALTPLERQVVMSRLAAGHSLSIAIFTPSAERTARGENVNDVRSQLSEAGDILKSMPLIKESASAVGEQDAGPPALRFAFLVASPLDLIPHDFIELEWEILSTADLRAAEAAAGLPYPQPSPKQAQAAYDEPGQSVVRVDLSHMDELMLVVGDLINSRYRLNNLIPRLAGASPAALDELEQTTDRMQRQLRDLRRSIMSARMSPLSEVFSHMPLAVRDLARSSRKEVTLKLEGEQTRIDKQLVDRLLQPLLHLVRNAITHGIENAAERQQAGKPARGRLTLKAQPEGEYILFTIADDGRGIDAEQVARRGVELGLIEPGQVLSHAEVLQLICRTGFSTHPQADFAAGRGVGLEVVQHFVHSVGGSLAVDSQPGQGTAFTLRLPLTLSILEALIVGCAGQRYAAPQRNIDAAFEIDPSQIVHLENGDIYPYQDGVLNLVYLDRVFNLNGASPPDRRYALVSRVGERRTALVVDSLLGMQEIVARAIHDPLAARTGIAGGTELGDGSLILILDLPAIILADTYHQGVL